VLRECGVTTLQPIGLVLHDDLAATGAATAPHGTKTLKLIENAIQSTLCNGIDNDRKTTITPDKDAQTAYGKNN